jgi:hypothetical protein
VARHRLGPSSRRFRSWPHFDVAVGYVSTSTDADEPFTVIDPVTRAVREAAIF